jgi:hypothetical protein
MYIQPHHLPRTIGLIAVARIGLIKPFAETIFVFIEANMVFSSTFWMFTSKQKCDKQTSIKC